MNLTDISKIKTQADIDNVGLGGISFKGKNLFDLFADVALKEIKERIKEDCYICSYQFVYLGYHPETNVFYAGFDAWLENESEEYASNVYCFTFTDTGIDISEILETPRMIYSKGKLNWEILRIKGLLNLILN